jgi:hypothetical protein
MHSSPHHVSLRRVAMSASFLKAIACAALGGYFIWQSTTPMEALGTLFAIVVANFWLTGGGAYLLAAFLLSRRSFLWRFSGGLIDATATAIVAGVILWLDERSLTVVYSCCQGDPRVVMPAIIAAVAVVWIAASVPMVAWFLLGAKARFELRRQQT